MYDAAFLLLVFLAELSIEHRALGCVSVYRDAFLPLYKSTSTALRFASK